MSLVFKKIPKGNCDRSPKKLTHYISKSQINIFFAIYIIYTPLTPWRTIFDCEESKKNAQKILKFEKILFSGACAW